MIIDIQCQVINVTDWISFVISTISAIHLVDKKAKWIIQSVSDRRHVLLSNSRTSWWILCLINDRYHDCILLDL